MIPDWLTQWGVRLGYLLTEKGVVTVVPENMGYITTNLHREGVNHHEHE